MFDAFHHVIGGVLLRICHGLEHVRVHGIQANRDPIQARFPKVIGMPFQKGTVGGKGNVQIRASLSDEADEGGDVPAQQRLSTGESDLSKAGWEQGSHHGCDFFVRQQ
tara:strand:+ start:2408 stop:2731 length:324 start_codon:yes stop_codon:yes gene_type:complete